MFHAGIHNDHLHDLGYGASEFIPSYIVTSTIAAPALGTTWYPALVAHMFCFYFAMFANLTPPVALAALRQQVSQAEVR